MLSKDMEIVMDVALRLNGCGNSIELLEGIMDKDQATHRGGLSDLYNKYNDDKHFKGNIDKYVDTYLMSRLGNNEKQPVNELLEIHTTFPDELINWLLKREDTLYIYRAIVLYHGCMTGVTEVISTIGIEEVNKMLDQVEDEMGDLGLC